MGLSHAELHIAIDKLSRIFHLTSLLVQFPSLTKETAQLVIRTLEEEMIKQQTTFSIRELFNKEILKPFFVSQLSMVFQQLTGLFVLLFYTQTIFEMVRFRLGMINIGT